jgi:hypothetical protein
MERYNLAVKVKAKDVEILRLRAGGATGGVVAVSGNGMEWHRVEAIHEEHASYREKVGAIFAPTFSR